MTAQDLKNSVLQRAMQGKLVEQRTEEGTAKELIDQIRIEKENLIKEGKIRKEKILPKIADEEIPFEIPESWEWVRLETVFVVEMGQSPDGNSVSESANGMEFHQGKVFFSEKIIKHSNQTTSAPTKIAESNSVLLCVRAPVGKVNVTDRKLCIGRGLCAIKPLAGMTVEFAFYLLETYEKIFVKKATGTTFVAITAEVVKRQLVPIPPLAEQKRIVAKIEELLPYIEKYDKAYSELTVFNKKFPEDMQKSILQHAMQGKLVEQRAEEGTGEELYCQIQTQKEKLIQSGIIKREKPLSEITEKEKPFDIPASWKWVKIGDIFTVIRGSSPRPKGSPLYWSDKKTDYNWITIKDISAFCKEGVLSQTIEYLTQKGAELSTYVGEDELIIAVSGSTTGKHCVLGISGYIYDGLAAILNPTKMISSSYLSLFFDWVYEKLNAQKVGSAFPNINTDILKNTLMPLPPLQEQIRIMNKIKKLMSYYEKLHVRFT